MGMDEEAQVAEGSEPCKDMGDCQVPKIGACWVCTRNNRDAVRSLTCSEQSEEGRL